MSENQSQGRLDEEREVQVTDSKDQEPNEEKQQQTSEQVRSLISILRQHHQAAAIHLYRWLCFRIPSNALNVCLCFYVLFYFFALTFLFAFILPAS